MLRTIEVHTHVFLNSIRVIMIIPEVSKTCPDLVGQENMTPAAVSKFVDQAITGDKNRWKIVHKHHHFSGEDAAWAVSFRYSLSCLGWRVDTPEGHREKQVAFGKTLFEL